MANLPHNAGVTNVLRIFLHTSWISKRQLSCLSSSRQFNMGRKPPRVATSIVAASASAVAYGVLARGNWLLCRRASSAGRHRHRDCDPRL